MIGQQDLEKMSEPAIRELLRRLKKEREGWTSRILDIDFQASLVEEYLQKPIVEQRYDARKPGPYKADFPAPCRSCQRPTRWRSPVGIAYCEGIKHDEPEERQPGVTKGEMEILSKLLGGKK